MLLKCCSPLFIIDSFLFDDVQVMLYCITYCVKGNLCVYLLTVGHVGII